MRICLGQLAGTSLLLLAINASATVRYVDLNCTNATPPFTDWNTAATNIQDAIDAADPGDQVLVTNGVYQTGGRSVNGFALTNRVAVTKPLTVQSINGPAVTAIQGAGPIGTNAVRCVYLTNGTTLAGFTLTNGATLDAGDPISDRFGGGVWCESDAELVSNCVIVGNVASGSGGGAAFGTLDNCVLTDNSSGYGGGGAEAGTLYNCTLSRCTARDGGGVADCIIYNSWLTSNSASRNGGGAESSMLSNCVINGNSAVSGGGMDYSWATHCIFSSNSATYFGGGASVFGGEPSGLVDSVLIGNCASTGGGAYGCGLNNCTVVANSASNRSGGTYFGRLENCIVYNNTAPSDANYTAPSPDMLNYCCTTPLPANGLGNITNEALFMNLGTGDFRLQSNSPCINAGNDALVIFNVDLEGNPRIAGGTVDIGAYEFQGAGLTGFTDWLWQHGLRVDGTADYTDSDADQMNNWQEWRCGTDPTNAASALQILSATNDVSGLTVTWQSVSGVSYFLERSLNLRVQPSFSPVASNLIGQTGTTSYVDTNTVGPGPFFYRVGLQ